MSKGMDVNVLLDTIIYIHSTYTVHVSICICVHMYFGCASGSFVYAASDTAVLNSADGVCVCVCVLALYSPLLQVLQ